MIAQKEHRQGLPTVPLTLSESDYLQLRQWFNELDWEKWDERIEADSKRGKLDFLSAEASEEKERGALREL